MRWLLHPTRLVLILAVVATAAIPALRNEFVWQVRALARAMPGWSGTGYAKYLDNWPLSQCAPGLRPTDPRAELAARPHDVQLRLALASNETWPSAPLRQRALDEALRLAPGDPVVLALAALRQVGHLSYEREEQIGGRRRDRREQRKRFHEDFEERLLTPKRIAGPMKSLEAWKKTEPDNAAPDVLAAYLLLGAKKDREALARAEAACHKRYFTLYRLDVIQARVDAARARGAPAPDAATGIHADLIPGLMYAVRSRDVTRTMNAIGWDHFDRGDKKRAIRYWIAGGRIGTLVAAHEREGLIDRLVGIAVQETGYDPIYKKTPPGQQKGEADGGKLPPNEGYAALVAVRGEHAAEEIRKELAAGRALRDKIREALPVSQAIYRVWCYYRVVRTVQLWVLPVALVLTLLFLLGVWLAPRAAPTLSRLWSAMFILLAIGVPLALAVTVSAGKLGAAYANPYAPQGFLTELARAWQGIASNWAFRSPLMLAGLLAIAALWVARKKKVPYRAALAGAMRRTLPTALALLAVIWVAATAVVLREGEAYATHKARVHEVGELRALQELGTGRWW